MSLLTHNKYFDLITLKTDECPRFTVNVSVTSVPVTFSGTDKRLYNAENNSVFQHGDFLQIVSCGFNLPFEFSTKSIEYSATADRIPFWRYRLTHSRFAEGYANFYPYVLFPNGISSFNFENYENFLDMPFDPLDNATSSSYELNYTMISKADPVTVGNDVLHISMINVPATLNGLELAICPWFKILHNKPMIKRGTEVT